MCPGSCRRGGRQEGNKREFFQNSRRELVPAAHAARSSTGSWGVPGGAGVQLPSSAPPSPAVSVARSSDALANTAGRPWGPQRGVRGLCTPHRPCSVCSSSPTFIPGVQSPVPLGTSRGSYPAPPVSGSCPRSPGGATCPVTPRTLPAPGLRPHPVRATLHSGDTCTPLAPLAAGWAAPTSPPLRKARCERRWEPGSGGGEGAVVRRGLRGGSGEHRDVRRAAALTFTSPLSPRQPPHVSH